MASTGPVADVPVTAAKPAKHQSWSPPSREEFMARLDEALTDAGDRQVRTNLGLQCWTFMDRVWSRRTSAFHALSQSGFLSNFHVSLLCSNSVRTRAARAMAPISLGLAVTC